MGNLGFAAVAMVIAMVLSIWVIPYTTDLMVNAAAGLSGKYLGRSWRTMVINSSTNNPELASMIVALFFMKLGGIANPLGSNFANIYLMFLIAMPFVYFRFLFTGKKEQAGKLVALIKKEKKLVAWHVITSLAMFCIASGAYYLLTGQLPISFGTDTAAAATTEAVGPIVSPWHLLIAAGVCLAGVVAYIKLERGLQKKRPELFEDIDEDEHAASWGAFIAGTAGLIIACWVLNTLFLASSEIYRDELSVVLGATVFAGLHFFAGALVTSLPEMTVAVKNYTRITEADLNTGMASASTSNMSNLALGCIGCLIAAALIAMGVNLQS